MKLHLPVHLFQGSRSAASKREAGPATKRLKLQSKTHSSKATADGTSEKYAFQFVKYTPPPLAPALQTPTSAVPSTVRTRSALRNKARVEEGVGIVSAPQIYARKETEVNPQGILQGQDVNRSRLIIIGRKHF